MDPKDSLIRKQWMALFLFGLVRSGVEIFLQMQFEPTLVERPIWFLPWTLFVFIGWSWGMYYYIYRKPGTKILMVCLALSTLSLFYPFLFWSGKMPLPVYISYPNLYFALSEGICVLWLIALWRMRKVNLKLKNLSVSPK